MNNERAGLTFPSALLLLFIGLKLANIIDWSWWWVFSPIWILIPLSIIAVVLMVLVGVMDELKK